MRFSVKFIDCDKLDTSSACIIGLFLFFIVVELNFKVKRKVMMIKFFHRDFMFPQRVFSF